MILNYLSNNRYSALYKREIGAHLTDFSNTSQILDNWLAVQNLWIYLEAVFVGGDIARYTVPSSNAFSQHPNFMYHYQCS
jgi:dynein heavy chain